MINLIANWWGEQFEQKEFKDKFIESFKECYQEQKPNIIKVNYDPDDFLCDVLRETGFKQDSIMFSARGLLPFKTIMKIKNGRISVKCGYGNGWQVLTEGVKD